MKKPIILMLSCIALSFSGRGLAEAEPTAAVPPAPVEASVAKLTDQLQAPEAVLRLQAVDALGALGPKAKSAVPALMNALAETTESDHPAVREATKRVAKAVNQIDPTAPVPPEVLTRLIRRAKAVPSPQRAGSGWSMQCLSQSDAMDTLGILGPLAKSVQPALVQLARKPCVQSHAVAALRQMGAPTAEAIPEILKGLSDKDPDIRQATLEFMQTASVESPEAILMAGRALNDVDSSVRLAALQALEKLHPEGEGRLPLLAPFLKDPSKDVRERALNLVEAIGLESRVTLPLLEETLRDQDPGIRLTAARLLSHLDSKNEALVTTLLALAKEPATPNAESAADLLRQLPRRDRRIEAALAPYRQLARRRKVQEAWAASTPQQRDENSRTLKVLSIKTAAEVVDDQPSKVSRHFPAKASLVTCWTEVSVSSAPAALRHLWYRNGKIWKDHYLEVISTTDHVWSSESVRPGRWQVEVRTEKTAEPLATITFTVGEDDKAISHKASNH